MFGSRSRANIARRVRILVLASFGMTSLLLSGPVELGGPLSSRPSGVHAAAGDYAPVTVAAGGNHSCVVTMAGTVKCWGSNNNGQLGDGTIVDRNTPVAVPGLSASSVALGAEHSCALLTGGTVKCWGGNLSGQLGGATSSSSLATVNVCAVGATPPCSGGSVLTSVTRIASAGRHTCAQIFSGQLRCWGDNSQGQLGDGTFSNRNVPVAVCASGSGAGCSAFEASSVSPGAFGSEGFTCAITSVVYCWGMNTVGQLGDGTTGADRPLPARVCLSGSGGSCPSVSASDVRAGSAHACARLSGAVRCWGYNAFGQLGDGTFTDSPNPVVVCDLTSGAGCGGSLAGVSNLTLGEHHSCAVTGGNGPVVCWGEDFFGQLGDGMANPDRAIPAYVCSGAPADPCLSPLGSVSGETAAGHGHHCARTIYREVKCWGYGALGSLGNASNANSAVPVWVFGFKGSDVDGDALPDYWEQSGDFDDDGDVEVPLPAMGADPFVKDLFVEIDWMDCGVPGSDCTPGHSDAPDPRALDAIVVHFWCAPERIVAHLDAGSASIMNPTAVDCRTRLVEGAQWGTLAFGGPIVHNSAAQRIYSPDTRGPNRVDVFHLARFQHAVEDLPTGPSGGYGETPGDEIWLGAGINAYPRPVTNTELWQAQTATFIHEIGHNLGLQHGGNESAVNFKPNHLSIMNYIFGGGLITNGAINQNWDYSRAVLDPLVEGSLPEQAGLEPNGPLTLVGAFGTRVLGTSWICENGGGIVLPSFSVGVAVDASANLDFNCSATEQGGPTGSCVDFLDNDGDNLKDQSDPDCTFEAAVSSNVGGGELVGAGQPLQTLNGYNDWSALKFNGASIGEPLAFGGASAHGYSHGDTSEQVLLADADGDTLLDGAEPFWGTGPLDPDTDDDGVEDGMEVASLLTAPLNPDTDNDGCADGEEIGVDPPSGGKRDPLVEHDFFDVPAPAGPATEADGKLILTSSSAKNKAVSLQDVAVVLSYAGRTSSNPAYTADNNGDGAPDGEQLDRTPSTTLGKIWRSGPPNGSISLSDVSVALAQVGHSCVAAP